MREFHSFDRSNAEWCACVHVFFSPSLSLSLSLSLSPFSVASGLTQEFELDRGSRQKGKLEDILDDPEASEAFDAEVILILQYNPLISAIFYFSYLTCNQLISAIFSFSYLTSFSSFDSIISLFASARAISFLTLRTCLASIRICAIISDSKIIKNCRIS